MFRARFTSARSRSAGKSLCPVAASKYSKPGYEVTRVERLCEYRYAAMRESVLKMFMDLIGTGL